MNKIKKMRKRIGLTQEQLACRMNIDCSTVAKWETGKAKPRADKLPELAQILKCKIDDLFE